MSGLRKKRRDSNPMSLAFLDVMFCGFGATNLLFLIIDHARTVNAVETNPDITAEVNLLQE